MSSEMEEKYGQLNAIILEQKQRLDHILSSINEVVWSCRADTFETIYINNASLTIYGYEPAELIGKNMLLYPIIYDQDRHIYNEAWSVLLKKGEAVFEYRIVHKDGSIRHIKNEAVLKQDNRKRHDGKKRAVPAHQGAK